MVITIDAELEARLRAAAAARGEDPNRYAVAVLKEALELEEDPDADLTEEDRAAVRAGVERSLKDFEEGRFRSFTDFAAEMRARYDLPD